MKIERPEGTVIVPVKGTPYVYTVAEKRYLKEKKYNVNKRVCVGKMDDDTYMIPNAKFYQMFPELEVLGIIVAVPKSQGSRVTWHMVGGQTPEQRWEGEDTSSYRVLLADRSVVTQ